jgi:hypothetical protein
VKTKSDPGGNVGTLAETASGGPTIEDIDGEPIDPIWAAEFRGFFWGEGTLAIQVMSRTLRSGATIKSGTAIAVTIGLRDDDAAVLEAFRAKLGGVIRTEKYRDGSARTIRRWQVGSAPDVLRVAMLLESPTGLPFNKARQLALWRRALDLKIEAGKNTNHAPHALHGSRYRPEQRAEMLSIEAQLKALRKWAG